MYFEKDFLYHVYNRSNDKVFYTRENYLFFLRKVNALLKPNCEILAWCLMPNQFHFLILATSKSEESINEMENYEFSSYIDFIGKRNEQNY